MRYGTWHGMCMSCWRYVALRLCQAPLGAAMWHGMCMCRMYATCGADATNLDCDVVHEMRSIEGEVELAGLNDRVHTLITVKGTGTRRKAIMKRNSKAFLKGQHAGRDWVRECRLSNTVQPQPACPYNGAALAGEWSDGFIAATAGADLVKYSGFTPGLDFAHDPLADGAGS